MADEKLQNVDVQQAEPHEGDPTVPTTNPKPSVITRERYAYYAYYLANNGVGPFNYSTLLFQNLIYQAGFDPRVQPAGSQPCGLTTGEVNAPCHVPWAGGSKSYTSVVNIGSGITFLGQGLLFVVLGATADYGDWAPWILRGSTVAYCAFQFGYLGVKTPDTWEAAMALFIFSNIGFWIAFIFFQALFPKIAADQPRAVRARDDKDNGAISVAEYDRVIEIERSKIMNYSFAWCNIGMGIGSILCLAALKGLNADASPEQNNLGYSVCCAVLAAFTLLFSLPWFFLQRRRPGKPVPPGTNILAQGLRNYASTFAEARRLPWTFGYLAIYFFLADGISTLMTQYAIAQSSVVFFSATDNTYFLIIQGFASAATPSLGAWLQGKFAVRTKTMLHASNASVTLVAAWGMAGIWTTKVGFHNVWEFWLFGVLYSAAVGLQMGYSPAFMGELVPRGEENQFFSLMGLVGKGGAWIGPIVSSALIDRTGNSWVPFGFLFALFVVFSLLVVFVDEEKARVGCENYLLAKNGQGLEKAS